MSLETVRRYYYRAAVNELFQGRDNLAFDVLARRDAEPVTPYQGPAKKTLLLTISQEFLDETDEKVLVYKGLEDIQGADEEELLEAGLEQKEVTKVLQYLASL